MYNFGLALRRDAHDKRGESLRYKDTSAALTGLKKQQETRWLREVSCVPLQQTLRHLDKAFTSFFEKRTDWQKQKRRVGRIHARIADKRRDFLHKLSTRLIQEHGLICLETLNVKGMMHNGCLARHIGQSGWSEFVSQLEYKAQLYGREVVHIDQWFPSSKQCSNCKHQVKERECRLEYFGGRAGPVSLWRERKTYFGLPTAYRRRCFSRRSR